MRSPTLWFPNISGFRKKRSGTIRVVKTTALISCAATAKLICAFVFAYADCWCSDAAAYISSLRNNCICNFVSLQTEYYIHCKKHSNVKVVIRL